MHYINFVENQRGESVMHSAQVATEDASYLERALGHLTPLTKDQYQNGLAAILGTAAQMSYTLHQDAIIWCIEWEPGLIVVRFHPTEPLQWVALRSPIPEFGGREPLEADLEAFDEDAPNHQYNLIFKPWDAQFDPDLLKHNGFEPADADTQAKFNAATSSVNALWPNISEDARQAWAKQSFNNLESWLGEGLRI